MDHYENHTPSLTAPATSGAPVSPDDASDLAAVSRALWIGTGGDLALDLAGGAAVTLPKVPDGTLLPVRARRVRASGTSAADIVALW